MERRVEFCSSSVRGTKFEWRLFDSFSLGLFGPFSVLLV